MKMKFHFFAFFDEFKQNFAIFLRNFDEILPEFHRNGLEMTKCLEILKKNARKIRKMAENSGIYAKFHSFMHHFFNHLLRQRGCFGSPWRLRPLLLPHALRVAGGFPLRFRPPRDGRPGARPPGD